MKKIDKSIPRCGKCGIENVKTYRYSHSICSPKDEVCNACMDSTAWMIPCVRGSNGEIYSYSGVPQELCDKFYALPDAVSDRPSYVRQAFDAELGTYGEYWTWRIVKDKTLTAKQVKFALDNDVPVWYNEYHVHDDKYKSNFEGFTRLYRIKDYECLIGKSTMNLSSYEDDHIMKHDDPFILLIEVSGLERFKYE